MCAAASDPYAWEVADTDMHMEILSILDNERINGSTKITFLNRSGSDSIRSVMGCTSPGRMNASKKWCGTCGKAIMKTLMKS